jgi:hypothetical protein
MVLLGSCLLTLVVPIHPNGFTVTLRLHLRAFSVFRSVFSLYMGQARNARELKQQPSGP